MKKLLCLVLVLVLALSCFAACGEKSDTYEVAFVTDIGTIDDKSFNEGTYTGVKDWAEKNGKTYNHYEPVSQDPTDLINAMETAIDSGAKVIVCAGFVFAEPLAEVAASFPDVHFIVCDTALAVDAPNVASFTYKVEQAGYLAGYACVKEGMTKLAYMNGIPFPSVFSAGDGFIQGADAAAKELGITIDMQYGSTQNFAATPENKTKFVSIFANGAEVLFSFGGGNTVNAFAAASEADPKGWVVTPDTDGTGLSDTALTSVMKELGFSAASALDDLYTNDGKVYFGHNNVGDVVNGMVGLPFANSKFENFTTEDYEALFEAVKSIDVKVSATAEDAADIVNKMGLKNTKLSIVK